MAAEQEHQAVDTPRLYAVSVRREHGRHASFTEHRVSATSETDARHVFASRLTERERDAVRIETVQRVQLDGELADVEHEHQDDEPVTAPAAEPVATEQSTPLDTSEV
ncbi:MAG: hypothetical protein QOF00_5855 [Pseudonocardiales bacterium]|jgi:hypothetical protein|nr:hypothetical protein [Pseudonocardiales bacterium]